MEPTFVCQLVLPECPLQSHCTQSGFALPKHSIRCPNCRSWWYLFRERGGQAREDGALALGCLQEDPLAALGVDSPELADWVELGNTDN